MKNELVVLKDKNWFERQKHAGKCVAEVLEECGNLILSNVPNINLKDLEQIAYDKCKKYDSTPTFLNYHGFPNAACISINKALVHGVVTDYILKEGDVISVDLGATFEGSVADAARTWIYGEAKDKSNKNLLDECYKSLLCGQEQVKIGNQIGSIGNAIYKYASRKGYGVICNYGGHGIGLHGKPHDDPFVANKQNPKSGIRITNGLSIAIEPMLTTGIVSTKVIDDGWTVVTPNIGCHFENSVTVWEGKTHIITETKSDFKNKWYN